MASGIDDMLPDRSPPDDAFAIGQEHMLVRQVALGVLGRLEGQKVLQEIQSQTFEALSERLPFRFGYTPESYDFRTVKAGISLCAGGKLFDQLKALIEESDEGAVIFRSKALGGNFVLHNLDVPMVENGWAILVARKGTCATLEPLAQLMGRIKLYRRSVGEYLGALL
jgi:hypothetical protein